jgi:hypothetical protein
MKANRFVVLLAALGAILPAANPASAAVAKDVFRANEGVWQYNGKPFFSTTAHAVFHTFRKDRRAGIKDLEGLKKAGFSVVEVYWHWDRDLDPKTNEFSFKDFDGFVLESKKAGLKNFCMFAENTPDSLAAKHGWSHDNEEGAKDFRGDDFYVCDPSFVSETKRFYLALVEHLKQHPEISENILYFNMGGEYKPFRPHRQPQPADPRSAGESQPPYPRSGHIPPLRAGQTTATPAPTPAANRH